MSSKNGFVLAHEAVFLCRKLVSAISIGHFALNARVQHDILCILNAAGDLLKNEAPDLLNE